MKTTQLKQFIRSGGYAWPGGYPMYALCADGEVIDAKACKDHYKSIIAATRNPSTDSQWEVVAVEVYWEGEAMVCAASGRLIESAYGVPE